MNGTARYAKRYAELGLALIDTPPGQKGPRHAGWNVPKNAIVDSAAALEHWSLNPSHGIACLLEASRLVSIDVDDEERSRLVLDHFGVNLDELRRGAPCIVGRHFRVMYRAPTQPLKHRALAWPKRDKPTTNAVVFELRAGLVSDTLPPTMHPGIKRPYQWEKTPREGFPPLPARVLELWQDWPETSRAALALCPWAAPAPRQTPRPTARPQGPSVIAEFNAAHDAAAILEAHGYIRRGKRFASPDTGHAAGVVLLDSGGRIFCHHGGDRLNSEHALDAFDVFRILQHGGDFRAAVRQAAQALGLSL